MADDTHPKLSRFPAGDPVQETLNDPLLDPALRLKDALDFLERAREEWHECRSRCDEEAEPEKLNNARTEARTAYHRYEDQARICARLEAEVRKRSLEVPRAGKWKDDYDALTLELKNEYSGMGPHYDLLCEHLASITIRIRMMEVSGRDIAGSELVELHKLGIGYVNQLQRYTEAMKSETINKQTTAMAERLMNLVDKHFGTAYPVQFQEFVEDVRKTANRGLEDEDAA